MRIRHSEKNKISNGERWQKIKIKVVRMCLAVELLVANMKKVKMKFDMRIHIQYTVVV